MDLEQLHQEILACRVCQEAGAIEQAAPVVAGRAGNRLMLVGQAPGAVELAVRRPFQGRAGRELFRWLESIGIDEEEFRAHVYMTAITKCFPGKAPGGNGDRRPSAREIAWCKPFLDAQLALVQPATIVPVGGLAIERFVPHQPLTHSIGRRFERDGVVLIPLPHPSGASRWLNDAAHKDLLRQALAHLRVEWDRRVEDPEYRLLSPAV